MCIVVLVVSADGTFVAAQNRDEFFDRPTMPLERIEHSVGRRIYMGRDALRGGTWMGASVTDGSCEESGRVLRFALLTNFR